MDHQRFAQSLPALYDGWGTPHARPRDGRFAEVLSQVRGMAAPPVLQLLNHAAGFLEAGEAYCEVGCFQGSTLIGALLGRPGTPALAADNFSEFDPHGHNRAALFANLRRFGMESQVRFHEQDCERFLLGLRDEGVRIGLYLYDGGHDYRSQLVGLLLAAPLLARHALIVVDDANWPEVRQGTRDFLAARPEARLLLDLPTPGNNHPSWWNGLLVLSWDAGGSSGHAHEDLERLSQPPLLRSLAALQGLSLEVKGNEVRVGRTR